MAQNVPAQAPTEAQAQPQQQRNTGWQMFKSIAFQMLLFYLITSYFRGGREPAKGPDGTPVVAAVNTFFPGDEMVRKKNFNFKEIQGGVV